MAAPKSTPTAIRTTTAMVAPSPISSFRTWTFWTTGAGASPATPRAAPRKSKPSPEPDRTGSARLIRRWRAIVRYSAANDDRICRVSGNPRRCRWPRALEDLLDLLLLTVDPHPESVLPSLSLLAHHVRTAP